MLKRHIVNYARTREVYAVYRKSGYSAKYRLEHEDEIALHRAAKQAFDALGIQKLPSVKSLNAQYARLLGEKKAAYAEYRAAPGGDAGIDGPSEESCADFAGGCEGRKGEGGGAGGQVMLGGKRCVVGVFML